MIGRVDVTLIRPFNKIKYHETNNIHFYNNDVCCRCFFSADI